MQDHLWLDSVVFGVGGWIASGADRYGFGGWIWFSWSLVCYSLQSVTELSGAVAVRQSDDRLEAILVLD